MPIIWSGVNPVLLIACDVVVVVTRGGGTVAVAVVAVEFDDDGEEEEVVVVVVLGVDELVVDELSGKVDAWALSLVLFNGVAVCAASDVDASVTFDVARTQMEQNELINDTRTDKQKDEPVEELRQQRYDRQRYDL